MSRPSVVPFKRKYPARTCKCGKVFEPTVYNQANCDECVNEKHAKRIGGMRT